MPLYEYECKSCDQVVEILVRNPQETIACPECGAGNLDRILSVTATPSVNFAASLPVSGRGEGCEMPRCCGGGCS